MAKIFLQNTTQTVVDSVNDDEEGKYGSFTVPMSQLAGDCVRKLWYSFRFASLSKPTDTQGKRHFERGNWEEHRVIRDLKKAGMKITKIIDGVESEMTGDPKEKQENVYGAFKHAKGKLDGRIIGVLEAPKTQHILEIKTMKDDKWEKCNEKGVRYSHPEYYGQMIRYMGETKLKRALLVATNKNTEKRLYQRIRFDPDYNETLKRREFDVIVSDVPVGDKKDQRYPPCLWCHHQAVCHGGDAPLKTCRSCEFSDLGAEGEWICTKNNDRILSFEDQIKCQPCRGNTYRRQF